MGFLGLDIGNVFSMISKKRHEKDAKIECVGARYEGYMSYLQFKNTGDGNALEVSFEVKQDEKQNLSQVRIVNDYNLPLPVMAAGDCFELRVECYYPDAIREFAISWKDRKKRSKKHCFELSKGYLV